jgi:RHS repeat-associated protein
VTGDFNGDGKLDLAQYWNDGGSLSIDVHVSTGSSLVPQRWATQQYGFLPPLYDAAIITGDFNGDGRTDFAQYWNDGGRFTVDVHPSTGTAFGAARWATQAGTFFAAPTGVVTGDFNGDGMTDLSQFYIDPGEGALYPGTQGFTANVYTSDGSASDLISLVTGSLGGTTSVQYAPSSSWANTNNPPIQQTVQSVTSNNMMGLYQQVARTTYSYSGGLWDAVDRRFLGFHYAKRVQPCLTTETACPYDETWYAQSYGSFASPQYSHTSNGSGDLLSATVYEYTTNGATIPYTSLETGHWEYTYDGTGGTACPGANCKRVYLTHQYDGYGNRTTDEYYGDYDVAGDETTSGLWYVYNPGAYIVSLAAGRNVFAGLGITSGSTLLQQTLYEYDGASTWNAPPTRGSQTGVQSWVSSSNGFATTNATYDGYGNVVSQTNASAGVTTYAYDLAYHIYPTAVTNPLQQTATFAYNAACGIATVAVDATGVASETTLDALCRPTATTTCAVAQVPCPAGSALATKSTSFVSYGSPLGQYNETDTPSADGNGPQWTRNYFDGNGRTYQTASKGPSGTIILTEMAFDNRGNLSAQSLPLYSQEAFSYGPFTWTTNQYDALNRVVKTTYPDASFVTHTYGLWSQSVTSEMGRTQATTFDAYGHSVSVTEGVGTSAPTTTSYAYDLRGFLSKIVDAEGNTTTLSFDSMGRKTRMTDPDMGTLSYVSDGAGRLLSQTDAKGQVTTFGYDALGRVTTKTVTSPSEPTARYSYTYDEPRAGFHNLGAVTTIADPAGVQTNDYDALGELVHSTRTIDGVEYSLFTSFANGRVVSTTYPDGDVVGPVTYDGAGRVASIAGIVNAAAYDASGNPVSWVNANGTVTTRQYSSREALSGIQTVFGGTTIQNTAYGRNADGTIASVSSVSPYSSWNYSYGTLGRLINATNTSNGSTGQWSQSFTYAPTGRMTSNSSVGTYVYPGAGEVLPHAVGIAGGVSYSYDANGNMLSGNGRIFDFDSQNRLAQVNQDGTTWNYTYDARDNRIKTTNGTTTTIYLGKDIEATNGVFTKYISLGGSSRVAKRVGNGLESTTYWLHSDAKGSVEAVTNASGVQIASSAYYPYGSVLSSTVTSGAPVGFSESLGYAAERQDATGLIYLSARYYDPQLCRFVSADTDIPGVASISLDRYAYSAGDPVNYQDPSGHSAIGDAWNIGAAFAGSLYNGAGNILKGVANAPLEVVKTVYDAGGDVVDAAYIAATGNTLNFQHVSALGKATDTQLFNMQLLNQYSGNTMDQRTVAAATTATFVPSILKNTFSMGTIPFAESVIGYAKGESSEEQMQENAGSLVFQAALAKGIGAYNEANAPEPVAPGGFPGRAITTTDPAPNVSSQVTVSLPAPAEAPMVVDAAPQPGPGSRVIVTPNGGPLTDSIAPFVTDTGFGASGGSSINATPGMSIPLPPPSSPFLPFFGLSIFDDIGAAQGFGDTLGGILTNAPGLPQSLPDLPANVFLGDPALGAPTGGSSDGEDDEGE